MGSDWTVHHPEGITAESGRWSHASSIPLGSSRLVFVAGQTARGEDGAPMSGDVFDSQFGRVYESLELVLQSAGASFRDVVSMRTFLTRRQDVEAFSRLRDAAHGELFPDGRYPPNTLVVVDGLAHPSMLLEVEAVAVISG